MSVAIKYNTVLILISLVIFGFTLLFKLKTESLFGISKEMQNQLNQYELNKRKQDISIKSIKASCYDADIVLDKLLVDITTSKNPCVINFGLSLQEQSRDSALFKIVEKIYEHAYIFENESTLEGQTTKIYPKANPKCEVAVALHFTKIDDKLLLEEIVHFDDYLSCECQ
ncbi:MAG: hypothetical protein H6579_04990 [Chitinophagales bacterium]|nr:hypothetical protein [Chitinophagales bacterium]